MRVNPEHKSCFKRVFCFNLRSFSENFRVHGSVMRPLTLIIKYIFDQFCVHFLTSPIHRDVNGQDTKFGSTIFNSSAAILIIKTCLKQNRCSGFTRVGFYIVSTPKC